MMNESLLIVIIILCCLALIISIASLVIGIIGLKSQKELAHLIRTQALNAQKTYQQAAVRGNQEMVAPAKQEKKNCGIIICRECYEAIEDTATVCPCCNAKVDRR